VRRDGSEAPLSRGQTFSPEAGPALLVATRETDRIFGSLVVETVDQE
jgi:hypothetical protein